MEDLRLSTLRKVQFILQAALGASLVVVGTGEKRPMGHSEHLGRNGSFGRAISHKILNVFPKTVAPVWHPVELLILPNLSVFGLAKNLDKSLILSYFPNVPQRFDFGPFFSAKPLLVGSNPTAASNPSP